MHNQTLLHSVCVLVQFHPCLKFYFLLFQNIMIHTILQNKLIETKIWNKNKIEPQHICIEHFLLAITGLKKNKTWIPACLLGKQLSLSGATSFWSWVMIYIEDDLLRPLSTGQVSLTVSCPARNSTCPRLANETFFPALQFNLEKAKYESYLPKWQAKTWVCFEPCGRGSMVTKWLTQTWNPQV